MKDQMKASTAYNEFLRIQWAKLIHRDITERISYKQFLDAVIKYKYSKNTKNKNKISRDDYFREASVPDEEDLLDDF